VRHRYPNAIAAELIPAVRRRVGAAPPARAAAAPLVVLHLISLLGDDVTAGRATRVRTAKRRSTEDTHDRVVRRKTLGDGC
jgi:hypothetical protein